MMKRLAILLLITLMAIPVAEAKRRETAEEIARKTRKYEGWEWNASGRFALIFYELDHSRIKGQKPMDVYKSQARLGGNITAGGGYLINNHWRVCFELGAQMQYNYTVMPVYATAHYFYGKRKNCIFNFLNLGTNLLFDKGVRFGGLGAAGVGYRFQGPDSSHKIDIMLGYQTLLLTPRPVIKEPFAFKASDVRRIGLNQSVFIGVSYTF